MQPSGIIRQETSVAVSTPGGMLKRMSLMIHGTRCRSLSTHMKQDVEINSAAMRGSTISSSWLEISRDLIDVHVLVRVACP
jgi:hypothetical protein